jgi:hypothetical protein
VLLCKKGNSYRHQSKKEDLEPVVSGSRIETRTSDVLVLVLCFHNVYKIFLL